MTPKISGVALERQRLRWWGAAVIAMSVVVIYASALKLQLAGDDLDFVAWANTINLPDYLRMFFDPRTPINSWYRPIFGVSFLIQSFFFGGNPSGYHWFTLLSHVFNSLLLFVLVAQYAKNEQLGFVSALVFASAIPAHAQAVYAISVHDTLMTAFALLCVWAWLKFLPANNRRDYFLALVFFLLALLTKEPAIMIPPTLFLIERIIGIRANPQQLARRYAPFLILIIPYLLAEYAIQTRGWFVNDLGYGPGLHVLERAATYLSVLAFPWQSDSTFLTPVRVIASIACLVAALFGRNRKLLLLIFIAVINILPVSAIRLVTFESRYLYFSTMVAALLIALGFVQAKRIWGQTASYGVLASIALALLLVGSSFDVAQAIDQYDWFIRARRVPFRDISQNHPEFPTDTFLYFINPPVTPVRDLKAMFSLRYGSKVSVGPLTKDEPARMREHAAAFVYYFDETGRAVEVVAEKNAATQSSPDFPVSFQIPIWLEGYEIARSQLRRGENLILLLYWRAIGYVDKDYTVFVQVIDSSDKIVGGLDSQPRGGDERTSSWKMNQLVADARVIPVPADLPTGQSFRLEIGLYYLPTLARVGIVDANGQVFADKIVITPFEIIP